MTVYLDHNATTRVRPEAVAAVVSALEATGNPSSVHGAGRGARAVMEKARSDVAALVAAPPQTVIFTSGGTEANALAIQSAVAAGSRRLMISTIEHDSVRESARAFAAAVEEMPVDRLGVADLDWLRARVAAWNPSDGPPFLALMLANNETGVIQPVEAAAAIIREAEGWLHVDAVQAAGKIATDSRALGADTLAISAHKLGGPMGVGALTFGPRSKMSRVQHGGGQERGRRAGTENLPGIAGFGVAARLAGKVGDPCWRDVAAESLKTAGAVILGEGAARLPNTLCVGLKGWEADRQIMALDLAGVMVSAGSACSSGKVKASPVIAAMGRPELAGCAIRVSGGWDTKEEDWKRFADAWLEAYARHGARRKEVA
jgi:cysteine desulfurase